jgi:hypothetical protein
MPSSYSSFRFRYIDRWGQPATVFAENGRVDRENGIDLNGHRLDYDDLHDTLLDDKRLGLVLKPYLTLPRAITDRLQADSTVLVLEIQDDFAFNVKSALDQNRTTLQLERRRQQLEAEGKGNLFRKMACPKCEAQIELTQLASPWVYCRYCESIFNQFQQLLAKTDQYKVCPQCQYYNRVQLFPEARFYFTSQESRTVYQQVECCDTCAQRLYEQIVWKNAPFLLALPASWYLRFMYTSDRDPALAELTQANRLAQDGNLKQADVLYSSLVLRNETHPGLRYCMGLAYLHNGDTKKAFYNFRESLEACHNYEPARRVLQIHRGEVVEK